MQTRPTFQRRLGAAALVTAYVSQLSQLAIAERGGGGGGSPPGPNYPPSAIVASTAPIRLPGSGAVTDRGAATYTMPLWVPPGPHGMQPSLSLSYSGRGNGLLGVGFVLGGLSAITPCGKSTASEGYADNADFGIGEMFEAGFGDFSPDVYCLDGDKLVSYTDPDFKLPTTGYPASYHTEVESFRHVVAHRAAPTAQPEKFEVHPGDGSVRTYEPVYGHLLVYDPVINELAPSPDKFAITYLLTRAVDRNGNRIDYVYDDADAINGGEVAYKLTRIDYGFGADGLGAPRRQLKFLYQSRPDPIVRYHRGVKLVTRSRLARIEAWAPFPTTPARVWSYDLSYDQSTDTGRSRLHSVQLCDKFAVQCSWTRAFSWTTATTTLPAETAISDVEFDAKSLSRSPGDLGWYNAIENQAANWLRPGDTRVLLYDLDGDGDDDALYRTQRSWIQTIVAYDPETNEILGVGYDQVPGKLLFRLSRVGAPLGQSHDVSALLERNFSAPVTDHAAMVNLGQSRVADMDGDGLLDLVLAQTVLENNGDWGDDGTSTNVGKWRYGYYTFLNRRYDHGSDAPYATVSPPTLDTVALKGPVLRFDNYQSRTWLRHNPAFQRTLADLDGDGKSEAIDSVVDQDVLQYPTMDFEDPYAQWENGGHPYHTTLTTDGTDVTFAQSWTCGNGRPHPADLDGDGRQDLLIAEDMYSNDGSIDPVTGSPALYKKLSLSDPIDPALVHGPPDVGDTAKLWAGGCDPETPDLVFGDFNGDGLSDALYPTGSYGGNTEPLVRWNLGRGGFAPAAAMPVTGPPGIAALMEQPVPIGRQGSPVPWDRGTRVADVDGDGRSDIIAVRQDNAVCVDLFMAGLPAPACENKVVVFRSRGDHFAGAELFTWANAGASVSEGFTTAQIGDVTGDGATDLVHVAEGTLRVLELPWRETPDLLAGVHDTGAVAVVEQFKYTRSWWGDTPRPEATFEVPLGPAPCAWPEACPNRGFPVVREHVTFAGTKADGTPMRRHQIHKYGGHKVSVIGRGDLGFATHTIWDRETGTATVRHFDQDKADPEDTLRGGIFYPRVGRATSEHTTTPRLPTPTAAELASTSVGPGLTSNALTDVQVTATETDYELRDQLGGRLLTVLPVRRTVDQREKQAAPDLSTGTPSYSAFSYGPGRLTTTTAEFDAYGNAIEQQTEISGGIGDPAQLIRSTQTEFDNRADVWQLGLPEEVSTTAFDLDDSFHPVRITRTQFDAEANPTRIQVAAIGSRYASCLAEGGTPATCEHRSSLADLTYDAYGNRVTTTETAFDVATPRTMATTWDADGVFPVTTTNAAGFTATTVTHPALGVPLTATDIDGITTSSTFDGFGRLRTVNRPGTAGVTRSYAEVIQGNRRGLKVTDTGEDGAQSYVRSDELGRMVEQATLLFGGAQTAYRERAYDVFGSLVVDEVPALSLAGTAAVTTGYDRLGRALMTVGADGAITVTDPQIFETTRWDPEGHESYVVRDLGGRVAETGHRDGSDELGELTFRYGPFDQISSVVGAAGNTTELTHDPFGRLIAADDPDTGLTRSEFDGFGRLIRELRATGDVITHSYDALGRPLQTVGPDGMTQRSYDVGLGATGKPTQVISPDGVITTLTYDALGRMHSTAQTYDGTTHTAISRYDNWGRLLHQFYPEVPGHARFTVTYKYGTDGFLRELRDTSACNFSTAQDATDLSCSAWSKLWEVTGRDVRLALTAATYGNGVATTRAYDPDTGRIASISAAGKTTTYDYHDDGQMSQRTDVTTNRIETFEYDDLHRLVDWTLHGPTTREGSTTTTTKYGYDELGNLLSVHANGTPVFAAAYNAGGRPHAIKTSNPLGIYDYDASGRQISGLGRKITWNQFNLPSEIETAAMDRLFVYDGDGKRVALEDAQSRITYLGRLYEHRDTVAYGQMDTFYVHGEPGVVAQVDYRPDGSKAKRYVVNDSLGSPSLITTSTGAIEEPAFFDPFGARIDADGVAVADPHPSTSIGFTGHETDGDGLINMQGRIYDRTQYRFLSPDPHIADALFGQSYNPYSYVHNDPLNHTDPTGLDVVDGDDLDMGDDTPVPVGPDGTIEVFVTGNHKDPRCGDQPCTIDEPLEPEPEPVVVAQNPPPGMSLPNVEHPEPWMPFSFLREGNGFGRTILQLSGVEGLTTAIDGVIAAPQLVVTEAIAFGGHLGRAYLLKYDLGAEDAFQIELLDAGSSAANVAINTSDVVLLGAGVTPAMTGLLKVPKSGYSVVFEVQLNQQAYGLSRKAHFRLANDALSLERQKVPLLKDWVKMPADWGTSPEGYVWHHAQKGTAYDRTGVMQLVPKYQHTGGSDFWRTLHPGGYGGYSEWGIPNGAPKN